MKKKILAFTLVLAMVFSLVGCTSKENSSSSTAAGSDESTTAAADTIDMSGVTLMNDGYLTVGVEIGYPPFEEYAEDGTTPIGYDIDFATALSEKLGVKVNFVDTAWDAIFTGIDVNYDVVISAVTITDDRKKTMSFSDPYIQNYQAVVVKKGSDLKISSFKDLDGLTIAVQKETTSDVLMSDYKDTGSIDVTISASDKVTSCFKQLANGEVDAVVVDSTVADGYLASDPDTYEKAFQDDSEPEEFGVAMGLDNTALQTAINEAIAQLTEEGFFEQNTEDWFGSSN